MLREYEITVNGVRTHVQLSDEDAARAGLSGAGSAGGRVGNKARTTEPGLSDTGAEAVGDSSRRSSGKRARTKNDSDDAGQHE